jgi:hypothetical protein
MLYLYNMFIIEREAGLPSGRSFDHGAEATIATKSSPAQVAKDAKRVMTAPIINHHIGPSESEV